MALTVSTLAEAFAMMADSLASGTDCETTVKGVTLAAHIADDTDSNPRDAESYTDDDIARFDAREWSYVGVKLTLSVSSIEGDASIWGVEHEVTNRHVESAYLRDDVLPSLFQEISKEFKTGQETLAALTDNGSTLGPCRAYATCDNEANQLYDFGPVGMVPTCQRCADRSDRLRA